MKTELQTIASSNLLAIAIRAFTRFIECRKCRQQFRLDKACAWSDFCCKGCVISATCPVCVEARNDWVLVDYPEEGERPLELAGELFASVWPENPERTYIWVWSKALGAAVKRGDIELWLTTPQSVLDAVKLGVPLHFLPEMTPVIDGALAALN